MLALQRGFAASKPDSCVITYLLQLKVLKHGLSLMKNVPGIQGVHLVPGDKIPGGADTGLRHNSRPCSSTAPAGIAGVSRKSCCICWSQQHKTSCAFIRELNFIPLVRLCKWLLGDSLPLLLTLSFWQGAGQRGGMPGEASALHLPLPPFPLQKSVWSLIQVHPGWDNSSTVRH